MIARWLSRYDLFICAYLIMVLGCIYFLFNYIEGISFSEKAGESILFRVCWFALYLTLVVKIALKANVFGYMIARSTLLLIFLALVATSFIYNGVASSSVLKASMYLATILFAGWVAISCPLGRFVETLYTINIVMLIFHVLIYPIVGSEFDYDPLHRATILGTEAYAGVFGHKNLAGWFFGLMVLISLNRVFVGLKRGFLLPVIVLIGDLIALAATGAAGPLVSIIVTCVIVLGVFLLLFADRAVASVYCLTAGFVLLGFLSVPTEGLFELLGRTSGLTGRGFLWSVWPHFFWQRPLLGYGFYGFFTSLRDAPSTELTRMAPLNIEYFSFENSYLEALVEFGILGGSIFALIACRALWNSLRFAIDAASEYRLVPFGLLVFTLVSSTNDNNLLLHNYFACVVLFWCYFGIEAFDMEPKPVSAQFRMRHV